MKHCTIQKENCRVTFLNLPNNKENSLKGKTCPAR